MGISLSWRDSRRMGPRRRRDGKGRKDTTPDYRDYCFSGRELLRYTAQGTGLVVLLAWFFYRSLAAALFLAPLILLYLKERRRELMKKRRRELAVQFRDTILSVAAGLQAGYSVENAFLEAAGDMERLYGSGSLMVCELKRMREGIRSNVPLERLLTDLGVRSGETDVEDFAEVFSIAKRTGGNMNEIIRRSAAVTGDRIEIKREIQTLLSARQYEQKIMSLIPFLIIAYLQLTSRGFFDVLYHNAAGIAIMTGALAVYLAAFRLSARIVEIEV